MHHHSKSQAPQRGPSHLTSGKSFSLNEDQLSTFPFNIPESVKKLTALFLLIYILQVVNINSNSMRAKLLSNCLWLSARLLQILTINGIVIKSALPKMLSIFQSIFPVKIIKFFDKQYNSSLRINIITAQPLASSLSFFMAFFHFVILITSLKEIILTLRDRLNSSQSDEVIQGKADESQINGDITHRKGIKKFLSESTLEYIELQRQNQLLKKKVDESTKNKLKKKKQIWKNEPTTEENYANLSFNTSSLTEVDTPEYQSIISLSTQQLVEAKNHSNLSFQVTIENQGAIEDLKQENTLKQDENQQIFLQNDKILVNIEEGEEEEQVPNHQKKLVSKDITELNKKVNSNIQSREKNDSTERIFKNNNGQNSKRRNYFGNKDYRSNYVPLEQSKKNHNNSKFEKIHRETKQINDKLNNSTTDASHSNQISDLNERVSSNHLNLKSQLIIERFDQNLPPKQISPQFKNINLLQIVPEKQRTTSPTSLQELQSKSSQNGSQDVSDLSSIPKSSTSNLPSNSSLNLEGETKFQKSQTQPYLNKGESRHKQYHSLKRTHFKNEEQTIYELRVKPNNKQKVRVKENYVSKQQLKLADLEQFPFLSHEQQEKLNNEEKQNNDDGDDETHSNNISNNEPIHNAQQEKLLNIDDKEIAIVNQRSSTTSSPQTTQMQTFHFCNHPLEDKNIQIIIISAPSQDSQVNNLQNNEMQEAIQNDIHLNEYLTSDNIISHLSSQNNLKQPKQLLNESKLEEEQKQLFKQQEQEEQQEQQQQQQQESSQQKLQQDIDFQMQEKELDYSSNSLLYLLSLPFRQYEERTAFKFEIKQETLVKIQQYQQHQQDEESFSNEDQNQDQDEEAEENNFDDQEYDINQQEEDDNEQDQEDEDDGQEEEDDEDQEQEVNQFNDCFLQQLQEMQFFNLNQDYFYNLPFFQQHEDIQQEPNRFVQQPSDMANIEALIDLTLKLSESKEIQFKVANIDGLDQQIGKLSVNLQLSEIQINEFRLVLFISLLSEAIDKQQFHLIQKLKDKLASHSLDYALHYTNSSDTHLFANMLPTLLEYKQNEHENQQLHPQSYETPKLPQKQEENYSSASPNILLNNSFQFKNYSPLHQYNNNKNHLIHPKPRYFWQQDGFNQNPSFPINNNSNYINLFSSNQYCVASPLLNNFNSSRNDNNNSSTTNDLPFLTPSPQLFCKEQLPLNKTPISLEKSQSSSIDDFCIRVNSPPLKMHGQMHHPQVTNQPHQLFPMGIQRKQSSYHSNYLPLPLPLPLPVSQQQQLSQKNLSNQISNLRKSSENSMPQYKLSTQSPSPTHLHHHLPLSPFMEQMPWLRPIPMASYLIDGQNQQNVTTQQATNNYCDNNSNNQLSPSKGFSNNLLDQLAQLGQL